MPNTPEALTTPGWIADEERTCPDLDAIAADLRIVRGYIADHLAGKPAVLDDLPFILDDLAEAVDFWHEAVED